MSRLTVVAALLGSLGGCQVAECAMSAEAAPPGRAGSLSASTTLFPLEFIRNVVGAHFSKVDQRCHGSSGLQLIGGGASKTGTKSLQLALERFGHKIYDTQVLMGEFHTPLLQKVAIDNATGDYRQLYPHSKDDVARKIAFAEWHDEMLAYGATATLDSPMNYFFEELMEMNPGAKVILTTHHSANKTEWMASLEATWTAFGPLSGWPFSFFMDFVSWSDAVYPFVGCSVERTQWRPWWAPWVSRGGGHFLDPAACAQGYEDFNQRVRDTTPPDRLLEFDLKDGWEPLCDFLDVPHEECPSTHGVPFPRVNSRSTNEIISAVMLCIAYAWPLLALLPVAAVVVALRCMHACDVAAPPRPLPSKSRKRSSSKSGGSTR